jgi:hypothetical protein
LPCFFSPRRPPPSRPGARVWLHFWLQFAADVTHAKYHFIK